ncbi:MAG: hypothetical protein ACKVP3_24805 [Hyphomicrobiaceae bacterium]
MSFLHAEPPPRHASQEIALDTTLIAAAALVAALYVPEPLILPALGVLLTACGFVIALYALLARRQPADEQQSFTRWDQAGLLVFGGFAVSILSDPGEAMVYLEDLERRLQARSLV